MNRTVLGSAWTRLSGRAWVLLALLVLASGWRAEAQQDPALQSACRVLLATYGEPSPSELPNGSATANWAILERVGLPIFLEHEALRVGSWSVLWSPVRKELERHGFAALDPLEAMGWWDETRRDHQRFVRMLASRGLLDSREPKERRRGEALRDGLTGLERQLEEIRANVRFEQAGWSFTGSASLAPAQRMVRMVLRGSQPCSTTGRDRAAQLALKGRIFPDPSAPSGIKVQLLESVFTSHGCEETFQSQVASLLPLTLGGEGRVSGQLLIQLRDESLTGRLQLDIAYRPGGGSLQTGHGIYSLRGSLAADGTAQATLTPVTVSGSKALRESLDKSGLLEGQLREGQGAGAVLHPVFRQPLNWRATNQRR